MTNNYKAYLDKFFERLLYYRHFSSRINIIYQKDMDECGSEKTTVHFLSALVISDWTSPTADGWERNFYSGAYIETTKDTYSTEIEKIYSKQLCLLYAQSFESFERFLKNCLFNRLEKDDNLKEYTTSLLPINQRQSITRTKMPGGDKLFEILKKAGGKTFNDFNSKNNINIRFKELWYILSNVRHAITHNESLIESHVINKSEHSKNIFNFLFNSRLDIDDFLQIELDYITFAKLIKIKSEFAFQVYKLLSIEDNLTWEL